MTSRKYIFYKHWAWGCEIYKGRIPAIIKRKKAA